MLVTVKIFPKFSSIFELLHFRGLRNASATPVRDLWLLITSTVLELESWLKKRKGSIFQALSLCAQKLFSPVDGFQDITKKLFFCFFFSTVGPKRAAYFFYGTKKIFFCIFFTSNIFLTIKNYWQRWNENQPFIAHSY